MAHLMTIGLPLILWLLLRARRAAGAGIAALALCLLSGAVVLSRSRAAWVGLAAALGVMALGRVIAGARRGGRPGVEASLMPRGRVRLAAAAAALGVMLALVLPNRLEWRSPSPYRDTLRGVLNYREGSGRGRLVQYRNTLGLLAQDPVFGVGPGNWPVAYPLVTTPGDPSFHSGDAMPTNPWPSSDWVAVLAERGPIGVLLLAAFFGGLAFTAVRRLRAEDPAVVLQAMAGPGGPGAAALVGRVDVVVHFPAPILVTLAALR